MKKVLFVLLIFLSTAVLAQEDELPIQCIQELQNQAKTIGLPQSIINDVLPNLKYLPKVIELDRSQPEFTQTLLTYLNKRVTPARIEEGQQLYIKHNDYLKSLTRKYGIPGRYLIAFWGLETNFGHYLGKMSTLNSLATLACDERRSDYFLNELLTALQLIDRESLVPDKMKGSWAGAMGHTQFMPSTYYQYSIDGDGDGQINLWLSEKDALASSANYLQQLGWNTGERWGREVNLPEGFPYERSGLKKWKSLKNWSNLGVTTVKGAQLPDVDIKASILVPSGHTGPAFLVYPNFNIIMLWNQSKHYALSVGLLADRIIGMAPLSNTLQEQEAISIETVLALQQNLNKAGFNAGSADGIMGSKTQEAIQAFQASIGITPDGYPDRTTITELLKKN